MKRKKEHIYKVLIIVDQPGWAFEHRAKDLMNLHLENIEFTIGYYKNLRIKEHEKYDLIYAMSVSIAENLYNKGIPLNKLAAGITSMRQFNRYKIKNNKFTKQFISFFSKFRGVNTASEEFVRIFEKYRPIYKTRVGIDEELFAPNFSSERSSKFTVGWVGRIDGSANRKLKGYDIVLSALKGLDVKLETRTFSNKRVSREQMIDFYQSLDCFICSSSSEHIPLPILEAASCGVPIITTNVGIVPELIIPGQNGIIVDRNKSAIYEAIKYLMDNPDKKKEYCQNIRETILRDWTWESCKEEWQEFFLSILHE